MPDTPRTLFVVLRRHWRVNRELTESTPAGDTRQDVRPTPDNFGHYEIVVYQRQPDEGGFPVRAFRDYAKALAFCREQEQARRNSTNPFRYGWNLESRTSLDLGRLNDWLLDAGLTPPSARGEERPERIAKAWQSWWAEQRGLLDEGERKRLAGSIRNAKAGMWFGEDSGGPTDLAWLDAEIGTVERWTPEQRAILRMGLIGAGLPRYPANHGERDHQVVETKWRDWWDVKRAEMTEYQRAQVWEALDKVRFYELVELEEPGATPG